MKCHCIQSREVFNSFIDRTIDLIAESSFMPIRRASVLTGSPRAFTSENVEVIKDKVLLKLFTLEYESHIEQEADYETSVKLLEAMRAPPEELLIQIQGHLSELPPNDADHMTRFLE